MVDKTNIETIVATSLTQLSNSPSDAVYQKIQESLKRKRRRRFLFWWFFGGIAVIGISLLCFNLYDYNQAGVDEPVYREQTQNFDEIITDTNEQTDGTYPNDENAIELPPASMDSTMVNNILSGDTRKNSSSPASSSRVNNKNPVISSSSSEKEKYVANQSKAATAFASSTDRKTIPVLEIDKNTRTIVQDSIIAIIPADSAEISNEVVKDKQQGKIKKKKSNKETKIDSTDYYKSQWSLSINAGYNLLINNAGNNPIDPQLNGVARSDKSSADYIAYATYHATENLFVRAGVGKTYLQSTYEIPRPINISELDFVNTPTTFDDRITGFGTVTEEAEYFRIPLELGVNFYSGFIDARFIGGVSYMVLLDDTVTFRNQDEVLFLGRSNILYDNNFTVGGGVQLSWRFFRDFSINAESFLRRPLRPYEKSSVTVPIYFNASIGLEYRL